MKEKINELKIALAEISDLNSAQSLLGWDAETYMPDGGTEARGNTLATLAKLSQVKFTDNKVGSLLDDLLAGIEAFTPESDDERLITVTKRNFDKATKVPPEMVAENARLTTAANQAWRKARENDDFASFEPHLEKIVDYTRRYAALFQPYDHVYDALLDDYEPGMKTSEVQEIFNTIRPQQVELIDAIAKKPMPSDVSVTQFLPKEKQFEFGKKVVADLGYDFNRGRQDSVHHPFQTTIGAGDHRITVRTDENFFNTYFYSALHEGGHAMYEQGVSHDLARTPLYGGTSLAIHESQSRLWENLVGRSKAFWDFYFPKLQEIFPSEYNNVSVDEFYKAVNIVKPSLIRVEADEATYNLHIMLRMEIEIALLEGAVKVSELPDLWNSKMKDYLGIVPSNNAEGVLQDVHWSFGLYGYFSTYALGNLVSVQLWDVINEENPNLEDEIRNGNFSNLFNWLNDKVYRHGSKFKPQELVQNITGEKINGAPYIKYLNKKFGDMYNL
jgi:carboxypeptidase Taq